MLSTSLIHFCLMSQKWSESEALKYVILAIIKERGYSQRQLAIEMDASPSNLNQRINAGSMKPEMIMKLEKVLNADILSMAQRLKDGEKWSNIIGEFRDKVNGKAKTIKEYEKIIREQEQAISELQEQVGTLISALNKFLG